MSDPESAQMTDLAWETKVWDAVAAAGFSGPTYDVLIDGLVRYGLLTLRGLVRSGRIFQVVTEVVGRRVYAPTRGWSVEVGDDIAVSALVKSLNQFHKKAREGQGWSPQYNVAITTFFFRMCAFEFRNEFVRWLPKRDSPEVSCDPTGLPEFAMPDPINVLMLADQIARCLPCLTPEQRQAILMLADGCSIQEIAAHMAKTARAVEGLIYRARVRLNALSGGEFDG
jgi:DNA-directed RNA polymerase specialized sigma24 family protein